MSRHGLLQGETVDCPHCGTRLTPELTHCLACGWKIRLSEILVQPLQRTKPPVSLPVSDVYYLFADRFLEPVGGPSTSERMEQPICDRTPVLKEALAVGLCRVAFVWLSTSGHLSLQAASRRSPLARTRSVVATPKGPYKVPTGSLEALILDSIYDRRQGLGVDETLLKLIGFWFDGNAHDWVLRVVKQHLLASPYATQGRHIGADHLAKTEYQVAEVRIMLEDFAVAQPGLAVALGDSIRHALDNNRRG